ncbi:DUF192 domain-containing protein [Paracoccus sp. S3-43]|uniref:DUF192 domain-containing protein n=1 Tax=Paracoccus sp. S3-43 TaxID=3030011 RepID=UPI0023AF6EE9|nr:DUF192 domain-containing protein [Paracoccus sp. S3-43]WEF22994.1 DUF192 domain-containing protein [Paracoccus sp. S3-43]
MSPNRAGLAALVLSAAFAVSAAAQIACAPDRAIFQTDGGPVAFQVELADDEAERAQGLMFRKALPQGTGMLFIYDTPRPVSFWMRNTYIPLDLVFLDERGVIRHIHRNARPLDETPIPGAAPGDPDPYRQVILEIGGGEAARLGLAVGQAMAHPRLHRDLAELPCG